MNYKKIISMLFIFFFCQHLEGYTRKTKTSCASPVAAEKQQSSYGKRASRNKPKAVISGSTQECQPEALDTCAPAVFNPAQKVQSRQPFAAKKDPKQTKTKPLSQVEQKQVDEPLYGHYFSEAKKHIPTLPKTATDDKEDL
ncbi:MAG: hypothetical protein AB7R69_01975, partial [Candidatus Babeliales bacterium]